MNIWVGMVLKGEEENSLKYTVDVQSTGLAHRLDVRNDGRTEMMGDSKVSGLIPRVAGDSLFL